MWGKWLPWRFILSRTARKLGFLDPLEVFSRLEQFAQPSEVAAPIQLLRSGVVLHARGLINSQAIQHNLDWIWPYWVERQFNPDDISFIPRAFSITHINLTHRNWTAVGLPDLNQLSIVDPRGLVTPFFDGFSLDAWILTEKGPALIPSREKKGTQVLKWEEGVSVETKTTHGPHQLIAKAEVVGTQDSPVCQMQWKASSTADKAWLVVALRPYNPEGISFIHDISFAEGAWEVNKKHVFFFDQEPDQLAFSYYRRGDVFKDLPKKGKEEAIWCKVGLATAAAQFQLNPGEARTVTIRMPLKKKKVETTTPASNLWETKLKNICRLDIPDEKMQFLFDAAVRTLVLHSPKDVYPGPYTYKRFWFRDAAFILHAMLCLGFKERVRHVLDQFPQKQTPFGYFLSQEGEWDSNGEALWIMDKYVQMTNTEVPPGWVKAIDAGGRWIMHKRLKEDPNKLQGGLFPAGFSAEHLGPNDYYYWDDFWGVAGLKAAGRMVAAAGQKERAHHFAEEAKHFMQSIRRSLEQVEQRLGEKIIPASPYRRMDAGAIGSLACFYPLQLWPAREEHMRNTMKYLMDHCLVDGGFFQDMTHSGINPYLTLHMAQVLLRKQDPRYFELIKSVADLASPTGQWPEAVHPRTKGGCMGDGQHVWAAAEWILMIRNCFVREEEEKLVLCAGIPQEWLDAGEKVTFGPALTTFGTIHISLEKHTAGISVQWEAEWFKEKPVLEIALPGYHGVTAGKDQKEILLTAGEAV